MIRSEMFDIRNNLKLGLKKKLHRINNITINIRMFM